MNILKSIPVGLLICVLYLTSAVASAPAPATGHAYSIDEMEDRIKTGIESVVEIVTPTYNARVRSYLRNYIEMSPQQTEIMMGRAELYFDLFEAYLDKYAMPRDLKYLAVVESALRPEATSHSGAGGIWQFMRATGRAFDLRITQYVDERRDPAKSTEAAVRYLQELYERFGSWELAMAAYNAGPGRVSSAIRRSGTRDYWQLSRYLPRETRAYVPGFIAVNYLFHHYSDHNLQPQSPEPDLLNTGEIQVFEGISLSEVSRITGIPYRTIKTLNPVYARNWIPVSSSGYPLRLPDYAIGVMQEYLGHPELPEAVLAALPGFGIGYDADYEVRVRTLDYEVVDGDNLYDIANTFGCPVRKLMQWNDLKTARIETGAVLTIHLAERFQVRPSVEDRLVTPVEKVSPVATGRLVVPERIVPLLATGQPVAMASMGPDPVIMRRRMRARDLIRAGRRDAHLRDQSQQVALPASMIRYR